MYANTMSQVEDRGVGCWKLAYKQLNPMDDIWRMCANQAQRSEGLV